MKKIRYVLEFVVARILLFFIQILPYKVASNIGAFVFRSLGSILPVNKVIKANLEYIYPSWSADKINATAKKCWDNFGRTCMESIHLAKLPDEKFWQYISVKDDFFNELNKNNKQVIFVSAHIANWEVLPQAAYRLNTKMAFIYRFANNPYVNKFIQNIRGEAHSSSYEKNAAGTVKFFKAMVKGASCGILVDQRLSSGLDLELLGKPAKTQKLVADLANKFDTIIVPVRSVRKNKYFQHLIADKPIHINDNKPEETCQQINDCLSRWINDTPEQWFWHHDRWSLKKSGKLR